MKQSTDYEVREMYNETGNMRAALLETEITLPLHTGALGRLSESKAGIRGTLIDTSCGSGDMLFADRERFDGKRSIVGLVSTAGRPNR